MVLSFEDLFAAGKIVMRIECGKLSNTPTCVLGRGRDIMYRRSGGRPALDGSRTSGCVNRDKHRRFFPRFGDIRCRLFLPQLRTRGCRGTAKEPVIR